MRCDPECPRCRTPYNDPQELFVDQGVSENSRAVKCATCGTLFQIDQVPSVDYDTSDACGNHDCVNNSFKRFSKPNYVSQSCLSGESGKCPDYKPTSGMVEEWEHYNNEQYHE